MEFIWNHSATGGLLAVSHPLGPKQEAYSGQQLQQSTANHSSIWSPMSTNFKSTNNDVSKVQPKQVSLTCPLCMVTLKPFEVDEHFYKEIHQLEKYRNSLRISVAESRNTDSCKTLRSLTDKVQWQTYQRIRQNRHSRLGGLLRCKRVASANSGTSSMAFTPPMDLSPSSSYGNSDGHDNYNHPTAGHRASVLQSKNSSPLPLSSSPIVRLSGSKNRFPIPIRSPGMQMKSTLRSLLSATEEDATNISDFDDECEIFVDDD